MEFVEKRQRKNWQLFRTSVHLLADIGSDSGLWIVMFGPIITARRSNKEQSASKEDEIFPV